MLLLEDLFRDFLETCRGQSDANRNNYTRRLRGFLEEHGEKPATSVTAADVNAWHRALQMRNLAPATLSGYRQALKALFNYCVQVGAISRSPAEHLVIGSFASSRADKLPIEENVHVATDLARAWTRSGRPRQVRDGLIWLLSLQSGPRLGEIRNLRLADVVAALQRHGPDLHGVYRVPSTGKTGRVYIRFAGEVEEAFRQWLAVRPAAESPHCFITTQVDGSGHCACRPLTRSAATRVYQRLCDAAGVNPPILSHALRHRLGDLTTRQFGPKVAAILLNHRDWHEPVTAMAFYHHPDESDASRAVMSSITPAAADNSELYEMRRLFGLD